MASPRTSVSGEKKGMELFEGRSGHRVEDVEDYNMGLPCMPQPKEHVSPLFSYMLSSQVAKASKRISIISS